MTARQDHLVGGYVSRTERAAWVRERFTEAGVPASKLSVNDAQVSWRAHRTCVSVQEGTDAQMRSGEFSSFMEVAHRLVRDGEEFGTRFGPGTRGVFVEYQHVDARMSKPETPAEAGEQLANPDTMSDEEPDDDAEEQAENDAEEQTEGQPIEGTDYDESVIWVGGHKYIVETTAGWQRVDLANEAVPSMDEAVLKVLALALPTSFDADSRLTMAHIELVGQAISTVNDAQQLLQSGAVAGGAGGEAGEEGGDLLQDVPNDYDEYDLEALEDDLWEWFDSYAEFESDFDPDIVTVDTARVKGSVGFHVDTNPFQSGYHDGDDWDDKDGYEEAQEAFRDLMQNKDEIDYYGEPDYVNHLPAAKVEDVI